MLSLFFLCCLPIFGLSVAHRLPYNQANIEDRTAMHDKIGVFIESLALSASQAQSLTSELEKDSNLGAFLGGSNHDPSGLITLACKTARACLGADSVETQPVNQTEVDANWLVMSGGQNLKTDRCDEGPKHAGSLRRAL